MYSPNWFFDVYMQLFATIDPGDESASKKYNVIKLIYYESFDNPTEAIKRERFLKSGQGRKWLDSKLKK